MTNPARPAHQAVGVADARMAGVMAAVLAARGASALVALEPGDGPLADRLRAGIARTAESVDTGAAAASLTAWVDTSRELAESST